MQYLNITHLGSQGLGAPIYRSGKSGKINVNVYKWGGYLSIGQVGISPYLYFITICYAYYEDMDHQIILANIVFITTLFESVDNKSPLFNFKAESS